MIGMFREPLAKIACSLRSFIKRIKVYGGENMTEMDERNIDELIKVLEDMINERIPVHQGCHLLSGMYILGNELIWYDFVEYDDNLNDVPLPDEYKLWNEEALTTKLNKLEENKARVLSMAKELLNEIKGF